MLLMYHLLLLRKGLTVLQHSSCHLERDPVLLFFFSHIVTVLVNLTDNQKLESILLSLADTYTFWEEF